MKKIQKLAGELMLLAVFMMLVLMLSLSRFQFIEHERESIKQVQDTIKINKR